MKLKYKRYGVETLRPVIPVKISFNLITVPYEVLVDSGADLSIFDTGIASILGIDVKKGIRRELIGITGIPEFYYIHKVTLKIENVSFSMDVGFMNMGNQNFGIVGQKGFFSKFIVKFDLKKEEIEIKERV